jgi:hypothetical protein
MSNFMGLWAGIPLPAPEEESAKRVIAAIATSSMRHAGGFATSDTKEPTGQQWDFPNAWPPLQWFLIAGLRTLPKTLEVTIGELGELGEMGELATVPASEKFVAVAGAQARQQRSHLAQETAKQAADLAREISTQWLKANMMSWSAKVSRFQAQQLNQI